MDNSWDSSCTTFGSMSPLLSILATRPCEPAFGGAPATGRPAGTITTYGKLAKELGFDDPRAAIDLGAANGASLIAIIVPCHRVIASNGDLEGYAWGLHRKRGLPEHEQAMGVKTMPEPRTAMLRGFWA